MKLAIITPAKALSKAYLRQSLKALATDVQKAPIIEHVQKIVAAPESPDVPQLEAEIDRLVYALYGLTDDEIALVGGKR